jgi:hypothetical protein
MLAGCEPKCMTERPFHTVPWKRIAISRKFQGPDGQCWVEIRRARWAVMCGKEEHPMEHSVWQSRVHRRYQGPAVWATAATMLGCGVLSLIEERPWWCIITEIEGGVWCEEWNIEAIIPTKECQWECRNSHPSFRSAELAVWCVVWIRGAALQPEGIQDSQSQQKSAERNGIDWGMK